MNKLSYIIISIVLLIFVISYIDSRKQRDIAMDRIETLNFRYRELEVILERERIHLDSIVAYKNNIIHLYEDSLRLNQTATRTIIRTYEKHIKDILDVSIISDDDAIIYVTNKINSRR
jgi:hypothetical protein